MQLRALPAFLQSAVLAATLSACGSAANDKSDPEKAAVLEIDVPEAAIGDAAKFDVDFAQSFKDSCVSGATEHGAPPAMAQTVCDCGVSELNKQFSAIEKARLTTDQLDSVMRLCAEKVLKTNG